MTRGLVAPIVVFALMIMPFELITGPVPIAIGCVAILLGGLPHGALDLAIMRKAAGNRTTMVLAVYLGLTFTMFAIWQAAPPMALALFLAVAIAHFAEDWSASGHPIFSLSIATALVAAPTLFHFDMVSDLFVRLTGVQASGALADTLLLFAPVASTCAVLAIILLWRDNYRTAACNAACGITAMTFLPPVIGFAVYFCLIHSPAHYRQGMAQFASSSRVLRLTVGATIGGLVIAFAGVLVLPVAAPTDRVFVATFMTLSILTLPHIALPLILRRRAIDAQPRRSAGNRPR